MNDLRVVPIEETDSFHPFWTEALNVINELAPTTRRDEWWGTEGPATIIFRALVEAKKSAEEQPNG